MSIGSRKYKATFAADSAYCSDKQRENGGRRQKANQVFCLMPRNSTGESRNLKSRHILFLRQSQT
jgi:hypothetical protein